MQNQLDYQYETAFRGLVKDYTRKKNNLSETSTRKLNVILKEYMNWKFANDRY